MFKTRLLSGILLIVIALVVLITGGALLFGVLLLISLIGMSELYKVFGIEKKPPGIVGYIFAVLYYALLYFEPQLPGETVYVDGAWTYGQSAPPYALTYRPKAQAYEGAILLKQGYYSYQYLQKKDNAVRAVEGNFWQTENEYTILIYYCQTGSRYDRLVGWRTTSYRPQ